MPIQIINLDMFSLFRPDTVQHRSKHATLKRITDADMPFYSDISWFRMVITPLRNKQQLTPQFRIRHMFHEPKGRDFRFKASHRIIRIWFLKARFYAIFQAVYFRKYLLFYGAITIESDLFHHFIIRFHRRVIAN